MSANTGSMGKLSEGRLVLNGAGYDLNKARPARSIQFPKNSFSISDSVLPPKISSVDALVKDLRKSLHAMFHTVDPNLSSSNSYENYSRQAFRYFTTTNTITQECFFHKVVRLGLQATPRLCNELFRRIDQGDLGEIDYATFAQRVFLPETIYLPDGPLSPVAALSTGYDRALRNAPQASNANDFNAGVASQYEYMPLDELEKCIAHKLEDKMPQRSSDFVAQAFRFFTNVETISFTDFHRHLSLLQIRLSPSKCRELFVRFDKDGDGVIDTMEFITTLFPTNYQSNSCQSSAKSSDNEPTLPTKQLMATIRGRMDELSEETDRFQQAFMLFGKPAGILPIDFKIAMNRLGLKLSKKQLQDLFATFDYDKSGDLDVNKFVQGVMLDDNSTSFWLSVKDRQKVEDSRQKLYSMAVASVQESWTIADIERMLREKIEQRTSRSSDCFRQAFRIFKKVNGIKSHEFHAALEAIGLALTRLQSDILFRRFDKDGSGDIDLNEFIHGVLPPDYMGISWVAAADELHRIEAKKKKEEAMANPDQYMTEIEMESWSLDEIETRIRDKIQQTTSRSSDTFRQAFKIFKKARHVTIDEFRDRLLALGFRLTPAQCLGLFKRYDTDNSNDLDLQEFCLKILPPDYTHDGDHWSHSEKFKKERQRQKLDYVKRTKNGLIMLPKFSESHRFSRGHYATHSKQGKHVKEPQALDKRSERYGTSDGTRPSTSSSDDDNASQLLAPSPPRVPCPSPTATTSSVSQHVLTSRHIIGKVDPLSFTSPRASSSPRSTRIADLQTNAIPPVSARIVSPTRPMSPRVAATLASPQLSSRSLTPRACSPKDGEPAMEYEDEELLEDDESRSSKATQSTLMSRYRHKLSRSNRHYRNSIDSFSSCQVSVRPAESVAGDSSSTFSGAIGSAKHMPQRNHVLLIKRLMQAAGKGGELKNGKRLNIARW